MIYRMNRKAADQKAKRAQIKLTSPDLHQATKEYNAAKMRVRRTKWSEEEKEKNRSETKIRMRKYRERKKEKEALQAANRDVKTYSTRQEKDRKKDQREKWKKEKQHQRSQLTAQKKRRIREKDRDRKREQAARKTQKEKEQQGGNDTNVSDSTLRKTVSRLKIRLPKSPKKYAAVVKKLVMNRSPRKAHELKKAGVVTTGLSKVEISDTVRNTYKSMDGRSKENMKIRRNFVFHLARNIKKRCVSSTCRQLGINRNFFRRNRHPQEKKRRKDALDEKTEKLIEEFYLGEDVSTTVPNKKAVDRNMEFKHILQNSYKASYDRFRALHPEKKVSFSKFQQLKPKNVLKQSKRNLLNCLCEYCENVRLKIETVNKYAKTLLKDEMKISDKYSCVDLMMCPKPQGYDFHSKNCVDKTCGECSAKGLQDKLAPMMHLNEVKWSSWDMVPFVHVTTGKTSTKRQIMERSGSPASFLKEFVDQVSFLSSHLFEARWQQVQFANLHKSLTPHQVSITVDFAENYTCFNQNEIQGAHWMRNLVTVHPCIARYVCPSDGEVVEEAINIVSDDLTHDTHAFFHFHKQINNHIVQRGIQIKEMFILSDGCAGQYKCNTAFMDASMGVEEYGYTIQRDYYGSRHGKNRCDGEGGILKSKVSRAVKNGTTIINTAKDFADYCQLTLSKEYPSDGTHTHKRRSILFVPKESIVHSRPDREVKTVRGTRQFHSVRGMQKGVILSRKLSCFCNNCMAQQYDSCENSHWVSSWKQHCLIPKDVEGKGKEKQGQESKICTEKSKSGEGNKQGQEGSKAGEGKKQRHEESKAEEGNKQGHEESKSEDGNKQGKKTKVSSEATSIGKDTEAVQESSTPNKDSCNFISVLECDSYEEIKAKAIYFSALMDPVYAKQYSFSEKPLVVDQTSLELMPIDGETGGKFPAIVGADGNCLPRCLSVHVYGNEDHHKEMRARVVIELAVNEDMYLKHEHLRKETTLSTNEAKSIPSNYAMYSEHFTPNDVLTEYSIRRIFQQEVLHISRMGKFMGIWQLFAAATVMNVTIKSVYPQKGNPNVRKDLHRTIPPVGYDSGGNLPTASIMWTTTRTDMEGNHWIPNHFSPLLCMTNTNEDLVSVEEEEDNFFEISNLSGILNSIQEDVADDEEMSPIYPCLDILSAEMQDVSHNCGQYLKIAHGSKALPAVVDHWPFVRFFVLAQNGWTEGSILHTVLEDDVVCIIPPPDIFMRGSRICYKFNDF